MIAFIYRAKRFTGTDKDSEVVLLKAVIWGCLSLSMNCSLEWRRLSLVQFSPTGPSAFQAVPRGWCGWLHWAGSHLGAVGAEGSLGTDCAAFVMAVENLTLQNKPLWSLTV